VQFPVLRHGSNVVSDSSEIFQYLLNTYPEKMKLLVPEDRDRCANSSP
jgi:glutathione S-transferase